VERLFKDLCFLTLTGANIPRKDPKKKSKEEPQVPAKGDDSEDK
jgi:hypothetical protein